MMENNNTSQMTPSGPPDIAVDLPIDGTSEVRLTP